MSWAQMFKADTDDLREGPAAVIVEAFAEAKVRKLLVVELHLASAECFFSYDNMEN